VALFVAPLAAIMGTSFTIGMRHDDRNSSQAAAWLWGINGAAGVLASIVAVMVSLWLGIGANLWLAAALYAALAWPSRSLSRA
jgi:hypothetical protein